MVRMRFAICVALVVLLSSRLLAVIIFESASLGQTGLSYETTLSRRISGLNVLSNVFAGYKFEILELTQVTRIGGHFLENSVDGGAGSIFGALVNLESEFDFPDSSDLSTPDVLGSTLISLPRLSSEASGELSLVLEPGWYAVIHGSGLFGADGFGVSPRNGADIGSPTYIGGQRNTIGFWRELPARLINQRFFVEGFVIPEPSTSLLMLFGAGSLLIIRQRPFFSYK